MGEHILWVSCNILCTLLMLTWHICQLLGMQQFNAPYKYKRQRLNDKKNIRYELHDSKKFVWRISKSHEKCCTGTVNTKRLKEPITERRNRDHQNKQTDSLSLMHFIWLANAMEQPNPSVFIHTQNTMKYRSKDIINFNAPHFE